VHRIIRIDQHFTNLSSKV